MKNLAVSLFIAFFLIAGCKDENKIVNPTTETVEIVPLKVGNWWSYQTTVYDTSGDIVSTHIDSIFVVKDTLVNGKKYFILSTGVMRWNNDSGLWIPFTPDSTLLYKYPAQVGDKYGINLKVICKDSSIVVPKGSFKSYGYSGAVATDFVSPGVGLIKEEWYKNNSIGIKYIYQKQELLDYHLN
jgi:hypothetical protein